jgi:hypothetical protein
MPFSRVQKERNWTVSLAFDLSTCRRFLNRSDELPVHSSEEFRRKWHHAIVKRCWEFADLANNTSTNLDRKEQEVGNDE